MTIGIVQVLFIAIIVPVSEMINRGRITVNGITSKFNMRWIAVLGIFYCGEICAEKQLIGYDPKKK